MTLRKIYSKVDFKQRIKIIGNLLQPQTFHSKYVHPFTIELTDTNQFKLVEEAILANPKFSDEEKFDLIFLCKDLLSYLKECHSIENYMIIRPNRFGFDTEFPLLILKFKGFTSYQQISLKEYANTLENETTLISKIVNFFLQ